MKVFSSSIVRTNFNEFKTGTGGAHVMCMRAVHRGVCVEYIRVVFPGSSRTISGVPNKCDYCFMMALLNRIGVLIMTVDSFSVF